MTANDNANRAEKALASDRTIGGRVTRELPREAARSSSAPLASSPMPGAPPRSSTMPGAPPRSSSTSGAPLRSSPAPLASWSMPLSSMSSPAAASRVSMPPPLGAPMAPHPPPVPSTCEPRLPYRSWFTGALLPICDVEVLIVVVQPRIMFDTYEANLFVSAFNLRFKRTIVLLSQDAQTFVPTFYGPAGIVRALSTLPFEMIPWQRLLYGIAKPPTWKLPIPPERPPHDSSVDPDSSHAFNENETRHFESIEDLAETRIHDPDAAARIARTTRR